MKEAIMSTCDVEARNRTSDCVHRREPALFVTSLGTTNPVMSSGRYPSCFFATLQQFGTRHCTDAHRLMFYGPVEPRVMSQRDLMLGLECRLRGIRCVRKELSAVY
jgi:hypothetical protein